MAIAFTWDHRNRLTKVTFKTGPSGSATKVIDYAYDAFNELVYREEDPDGASGSTPVEKTTYIHDGGQVVMQFNKTGSGDISASNLSHRYLWAEAVDQLLADEQVTSLSSAGAAYWALTDHLGSVRDVVDSNGKARIHRSFDGFGNVVDESHYDANENFVTAGQPGYVDEAFAYTGRPTDETTGLQNNLNRWYNPATGRWLSEDPIGFDAGDANLYRYVGNMPTMAADPTGHGLVLLPPEDDPDKYKDMSFDPSDLVCPIAVAPKIGGSGLYKIYKILFPSKKAAREAAQHAGKCGPMHHPSPKVGRPHYHPTDQSGKKIPGVHYEYSR